MARDRNGHWLSSDGITPLWRVLLSLARGIAETPAYVLEHRAELRQKQDKQEDTFAKAVNESMDSCVVVDGIRLEQGEVKPDGSHMLSVCLQIDGSWYELIAERAMPNSCHTIGAVGIRRLLRSKGAQVEVEAGAGF